MICVLVECFTEWTFGECKLASGWIGKCKLFLFAFVATSSISISYLIRKYAFYNLKLNNLRTNWEMWHLPVCLSEEDKGRRWEQARFLKMWLRSWDTTVQYLASPFGLTRGSLLNKDSHWQRPIFSLWNFIRVYQKVIGRPHLPTTKDLYCASKHNFTQSKVETYLKR